MPEKKLICLGDSITWGFPYGPEYSWVALSARALDFPIINRGINGDTALDLINRFGRDVLAHAPSHVMIMIGSNDASIGVTLKTFCEQITTLLSLAAEHEIIPLLGLPVPSGDKWLEYTLVKYRHWLRSKAVSGNIDLVDFSPAMQLIEGALDTKCYSDGVHPSKAGYRAMAELFCHLCRNFHHL